MRVRSLAALAAFVLSGVPALAGPLDPPPSDTVRVWLVEWAGGNSPRVQDGQVTYRRSHSRSILAVIPFEVRGNRRELFGGYWASFAAAKDSGAYPSVWRDGHEVVPACPVSAACTHPVPFPIETTGLDGDIPGRRSYYVIALNDDVLKITTSPGWKPPRELKEKLAVRIVQPNGSGARAGWVAGVEHFTGASAPGGRYGSFAFTVAPCDGRSWTGIGAVVLRGGDPNPEWRGDDGTRRAQCTDPYVPVAKSAANRQTTWRVEGQFTSTQSADPNRLVVMDLPRFHLP